MKGRSQSSSIQTKPSKLRGSKNKAKPLTVWTVRRAVAELPRHGSRRNGEGMAHFGIRTADVYGVSKPKLDKIARDVASGDMPLGKYKWLHSGARLSGEQRQEIIRWARREARRLETGD
jgi:hypothetical protein